MQREVGTAAAMAFPRAMAVTGARWVNRVLSFEAEAQEDLDLRDLGVVRTVVAAVVTAASCSRVRSCRNRLHRALRVRYTRDL